MKRWSVIFKMYEYMKTKPRNSLEQEKHRNSDYWNKSDIQWTQIHEINLL